MARSHIENAMMSDGRRRMEEFFRSRLATTATTTATVVRAPHGETERAPVGLRVVCNEQSPSSYSKTTDATHRTPRAAPRQRTAPPRRAARTRVRTIGAGWRALRNREETKVYLVYLLLCFCLAIFSAPDEPHTAEVPRALGSRQPRGMMTQQ